MQRSNIRLRAGPVSFHTKDCVHTSGSLARTSLPFTGVLFLREAAAPDPLIVEEDALVELFFELADEDAFGARGGVRMG
jgi:hypothetical protein